MLGKVGEWFIILLLLFALSWAIITYMPREKMETESDELKEYCITVLSDEVTSEYEDEMLKVQAVLVRTTIYKEIQEQGEKFWENAKREKEIDIRWRERLEKAWDETEGQVILYKDKLALVPFHRLSNGKTRSGEEVLGTKDYPYLQIVECTKDVNADNQVQNIFIPETNVKVDTWDSAGYVVNLSVNKEKISGEEFREQYGLPSSCFEVQDFDGQTRILTKGIGHGLGLSQYSANEMAKDGKSHKEILQKFFPGTEIKEVAEILWNIE